MHINYKQIFYHFIYSYHYNISNCPVSEKQYSIKLYNSFFFNLVYSYIRLRKRILKKLNIIFETDDFTV